MNPPFAIGNQYGKKGEQTVINLKEKYHGYSEAKKATSLMFISGKHSRTLDSNGML